MPFITRGIGRYSGFLHLAWVFPSALRQTVTLAEARLFLGDYSCRNSSGLSHGFPCTRGDRTHSGFQNRYKDKDIFSIRKELE